MIGRRRDGDLQPFFRGGPILATLASATLSGVEGRSVTVEVHVADGLPGFSIVGLPDASCREACDRVRAAIVSSGASWPLRRITVNGAEVIVPSHLRAVFDAVDDGSPRVDPRGRELEGAGAGASSCVVPPSFRRM